MATGKRFYWMKLKESFMTSDTIDYFMSQPNGANATRVLLDAKVHGIEFRKAPHRTNAGNRHKQQKHQKSFHRSCAPFNAFKMIS